MLRVLTRGLLITSVLATPSLAAAPEAVSQARLRADVESLVSFGTRHTLSVQDDPKRGIGAARRWAEGEFRKTSAACGNCLEVVLPERMVMGDRVPKPTRLVNVVAIQRGTERPNEVVIVQGHIDSRVTNVMNATADSPGANDDGSGTALVLEAARVLSRNRYPTTIVYAVLSGEEQGLLGGKLLADYAKEQGWTVKAVLNNDIVGNTRGSDGLIDAKTVRVFSEGPRADGDDKLRAAARRFGGENDNPSRNLSRYVAGLAAPELAVRQIWRTDRMGRGGDHIPFLDAGIPAIRFSVGVENYDHQHQDLRNEKGKVYGDTIEFMDFPYLAKVTRLNVRALAAIANAPAPPETKVEAAVSTDTKVSWNPAPGATTYCIYRRATTAAIWGKPFVCEAENAGSRTLKGVRGDDWIFGVSAISAKGSESPISSAVPGGQFAPLK
ncbi:M28 family peptidase [Novosphingobium aquae]|uniref:M28 family peptidase n=1 Tax=Novosphingobium aquae TaxID=3133435 RepID=A0ABU8S5H8_9SPHN